MKSARSLSPQVESVAVGTGFRFTGIAGALMANAILDGSIPSISTVGDNSRFDRGA